MNERVDEGPNSHFSDEARILPTMDSHLSRRIGYWRWPAIDTLNNHLYRQMDWVPDLVRER